MTEANDRAVIGDNNPPPESALDTWAEHVASLFELAESVGKIETAEHAASIGQLKADATKAEGDIKKAVTAERKPHTDAANAISKAYKPVIDRVALVKDTAAKLLKPWLEEQDRLARAAEEKARQIARDAEEAARKAAAETDETDIASVEAANEAEKTAKRAKTAARVAASAKPKAATDGRAVSLRTVGYDVTITDRKALLFHVAETDAAALEYWLHSWAEGRARETKGVALPGCTVTPRRVAA